MSEAAVRHETVRVERSFSAPAERVFQAWSDPDQLRVWYSPGPPDWIIKVLEHDFRVGGRKRVAFGPPDDSYVEDCVYADIVPNERICFAMTVAHGDERLTASMVTVEIQGRDAGSQLVVTDQMAILDGSDSAAAREEGWEATVDKLVDLLGRA